MNAVLRAADAAPRSRLAPGRALIVGRLQSACGTGAVGALAWAGDVTMGCVSRPASSRAAGATTEAGTRLTAETGKLAGGNAEAAGSRNVGSGAGGTDAPDGGDTESAGGGADPGTSPKGLSERGGPTSPLKPSPVASSRSHKTAMAAATLTRTTSMTRASTSADLICGSRHGEL